MGGRICPLGRERRGWLSAGLDRELTGASNYVKIGKPGATVPLWWSKQVPGASRNAGACWPLGEDWAGVTLVPTPVGTSPLCLSLGLRRPKVAGVCVSGRRCEIGDDIEYPQGTASCSCEIVVV